MIFTLDFVICTKPKPLTCFFSKKMLESLNSCYYDCLSYNFIIYSTHHCSTAVLTSRHRGQTSVRDKVGGEDPNAPVIQPPLPPVILWVRLGDDGDAVAGGDAQVAGLLTGEWVDGRDYQLTGGSAHWRTVTWGGEMAHASFKGAVQHSHCNTFICCVIF